MAHSGSSRADPGTAAGVGSGSATEPGLDAQEWMQSLGGLPGRVATGELDGGRDLAGSVNGESYFEGESRLDGEETVLTDQAPRGGDNSAQTIALSESQLRSRRREFRFMTLVLLVEIGDTAYDLGAFVLFELDRQPGFDVLFARLYLACVVLATLASTILIRSRWLALRDIRKEIWSRKVLVKKKIRAGAKIDDAASKYRSRKISPVESGVESEAVASKFEDPSASRIQTNEKLEPALKDACEKHPEMEIAELQRRKRILQGNFVVAICKDLAILILSVYRIWAMKHAFDADFRSCMVDPSAVFFDCASLALIALFSQVVLSAMMVSFRLSHGREWIAISDQIISAQGDLVKQAMMSKSVLDDFTDIEEAEVNLVVALRNLLGAEITRHPTGVLGDVNLLRFVRASDGDVFRALEMVRKMLEARERHGVGAMLEQILEQDMAYTDIPNAEKFSKCLKWGMTVSVCSTSGLAFNIFEAPRPAIRGLGSDDFSWDDFLRCHLWCFEIQRLILDKLCLTEKRMVMPVSLWDAKKAPETKWVHFMKLMQFGVRLSPAYAEMCPGTVKHIAVANVGAMALKAYKLTSKLFSKEVQDKVILFGDTDEDRDKFTNMFPASCVPKTMGGNLEINGDPTCAVSSKTPISHYLGRHSELDLFIEVPSEQVELVKSLEDAIFADCPEARRLPHHVVGHVNLLRFLREENLNLAKAKATFLKTLEWRDQVGITATAQKLLEENLSVTSFPETVRLLCAWRETAPLGFDRSKGLVINFMFIAQARKVSQQFPSVDDFVKHRLVWDEFCAIILDKLSLAVRRVVALRNVMPVDGAAHNLPTLFPYLIESLLVTRKRYPQRSEGPVLFKVNAVVLGLYRKLISPALPSKIRARLVMVPAGRKGQEELASLVGGAVNIPRFLGGKNHIMRAVDDHNIRATWDRMPGAFLSPKEILEHFTLTEN
ncbi:Uncharacterized protein SCF082_LOCUS44139 [Durusdinium trenchii]|uniref:CRAL/TRIO N-terminal domain-containing protein n=1 Tax=Durusdinium trenchii TaxID=1381693 RepID=A0ABP0R0V2_9DINO